MAETVRIPLFTQPLPRSSDSQIAPYSNETSGTTDDGFIAHFSATVDSSIEAYEDIPNDYDSLPKLVMKWTSGATAGNVRISVNIRVYEKGVTVFSGTTSPVVRTDAITTSGKPGTADRYEVDIITLTATDWVAARKGDMFKIKVTRLATHGDDGKADVVNARFSLEYDTA